MMELIFDESLFKSINKSPRGGYRNHIGYDDCELRASHFHYVCDGDGNQLTDISSLPGDIQVILKRYTREVRSVASYYVPAIGETCIRVLWYPKQETKDKNHGKHTDFCWLTVPLADSFGSFGAPFYGEMAKIVAGISAKPHTFKASPDKDRVYIVGFVQLPFDTITNPATGETYADVLNKLCSKHNAHHTNNYKG